jgi:acyl-CoA synthetase (NDP forming)
MFGLGGTFVEVLKDVSFRVVPVSLKEAKEMIEEIKGYKILEGYRGQEAVDTGEIARIIVNLSNLSLEKEEIKEIDFNPIIASGKEIFVCDAKIII